MVTSEYRRGEPRTGVICHDDCGKHSIWPRWRDTGGHRESCSYGQCAWLHIHSAGGKVTAWWRHQMETFSALLALCVGNSPVPVNSPHKGRWRGALMFSLICFNKQLGKKPWGWWFETPSWSLWRHYNVETVQSFMPSLRSPSDLILVSSCIDDDAGIWALWRLQPSVTRLFVQQHVQINNKLNTKVCIICHLGGAAI